MSAYLIAVSTRRWLPGFSRFVYLLRREDGLYKIGMSRDPEWRRKSLAARHGRFSADRTLTLVASVEVLDWGGVTTLFLERALHNRFAHCRRRVDDSTNRTEWFALSQEEADAFEAAVWEAADSTFRAPPDLARGGDPLRTRRRKSPPERTKGRGRGKRGK